VLAKQWPSPRIGGARWYSDAASEKAPTEGKEETGTTSEVDALKKEVEAKNKEVIDLKDRYLRSVADYRNLQERTKRESANAHSFALTKLARDILPSLDTLSLAISSIPPEKLSVPTTSTVEIVHGDLVNLHQGLTLTESGLLNVLGKHGITPFDPAKEGVKFDPNHHEAVFHAPMPGKEDDTVFHTQQKGFMLNGRVLRAAQVGVVKNS